MKEHELKTDPKVFQDSWDGVKTFEVRLNDRDFKIGDGIWLRETRHSSEEMKQGKPLEYTGRELYLSITYILHGPIYGLAPGWVIMGGVAGLRGRD